MSKIRTKKQLAKHLGRVLSYLRITETPNMRAKRLLNAHLDEIKKEVL